MNQADNFEIKYWGEEFNNLYQEPQKHRRSSRQKLVVVISFVAVLAILPIIIFGLSNISLNKLQIATTIQTKPEPTKTPPVKEKEKPEQTEVTVINNDSYWKISKRYCGTGKYYLSIRDQNDAKPLYKDDVVKVNCSL